MQNYDAIVIGGGPGGYECAIRLSQNGLKAALVEKDKLGGTCLNRGCIPTKVLLHAAEVYSVALSASEFGVNIHGVSFDYRAMVDRSKAVSKHLCDGIAFLEKNYGVSVYRSSATVIDRHTVMLATGDLLKCEHLILATGSSPARLSIPGADLPGVLDSTDLLNLTECPKSIVIIGGGVVGIEFATLYACLGVEVTIVEMLNRILAPFDRDISGLIEAELREKGVQLALGAKVKSIEGGLCVNYTTAEGVPEHAEGEKVLIAGGRIPNSRNIGLENIGVRTNRKGFVEVDGLCRTSVTGVYAIGDINGSMMLAHVASAQGILAADHIAGNACQQLNLNHVPSCVYCSPEVSMVGLTEERALAAGYRTGTGLFSLSSNGRALSMGRAKGLVKFVFDLDTDEILGFHMAGPNATELAAEIAAAMESEGTIREICSAVHPHPTVSEAIMEAARACHGCCVNVPKPRK